MKRTSLPPRRAPLRAMSAKRRARAADRRACVEIVRRRDRWCTAMTAVPHVACWGPLDVHEVVSRARGGDPYDPAGCRLLCRAHHDFVTTHPAEATALGLLRSA